jgi:DNA-binding NarL/FixJ family response regulator
MTNILDPALIRNTGVSAPRSAERGVGVVLIDQIPLFRDAMATLVNQANGLRWLGATQNVHSAMVMNERLRPEVAVIDSILDPRGHLGKLMMSASPTLAVLSLVREPHRSPSYLAEVVASGLHGVLLRSAEPAQLVEAIRRTHAERRYVDPALSTLTGGMPVNRAPGARQPLSRREYQVLQLISDGLENQAIAKALFVSVETVRTHVKSILRKLHARDRAHSIAIAFRLGVLVPQGERTFVEEMSGQSPQAPQVAKNTRGANVGDTARARVPS